MTQRVTSTSPAPQPITLQLAVAAWLDEHQPAPLTHRAYDAELRRFRAELQRVDLDLASAYGLVALVAQSWASAGEVGAVTHNKRLSIVSSFYRYAIKHTLLAPPNPIDLVRRRPHAAYARAQALDVGEVRARLADIDRSTRVGARDYALLSLGLATGRRLRELAGLRVAHIHPLSDDRVKLMWSHTKGHDDPVYDTLPTPLTQTLLGYLDGVYGAGLDALPHDAPVWISLSNNHRGGALSISAIADVCALRLGTSKVHQLRHTFAHMLEAAGAPLSTIQQRLGHASAATTAIYVQALRADENPYAEDLVRVLGVEG
jgi:integrase/recombinase XerD